MNKIQEFIKDNQKRLNSFVIKQESCYGLFAFSCGAFLVSLLFVVNGYKVQPVYYLIPLTVALTVFVIRFVLKRFNESRTIKYADSFYQLNDSLVTYNEFSRKSLSNGFYALQKEHTENLTKTQDINRLPFQFPKRFLYISIILILLNLWFCTFDNSAAVRNRLEDEQETLDKSKVLNDFLTKQLDELKDELTDEEKDLLEKSKLPKMMKDLQKTKDRKEALRQYAKLEKELQKLTERSKMALDEKLFAEMAKKLMKNQDTKKFGQTLSKKEFNKAAQELNKLKQDPKKPFSDENRKNLDKLKKMAERMNDASKNFSKNKNGLKDKVEKLSEAVKKMEQQMQQNKECQNPSECQKNGQEMNKQLSQLSKHMKNHGTKKQFMKKMQGMKNALMMAQSKMAQKGKQMGMPSMSKQEGKGKGKGIGMGADNSKNENPGSKANQGYVTKLQGQKGKGPSDISVQDAESGSGTSQINGKSEKRDYKFQLESYIQREDVPENMKQGVKRYFKTIHNENK